MHTIRLVILTFFISVTFAKQFPVFLWGAHSVAKPSLTTVSGEEFGKLVTPLLAKKALIVFLESDLNNKDFLCTNIDDGKSCYARLQGVSDKTYYVGVENPFEVLSKIDGKHEYNSVDSTGKLKKALETDIGAINFVKFDDEEQFPTRGSRLHSHDSIIASITSQAGDNVFFLYTSSPSESSLKRQRRQASDSSEGYVFRNKANLLLYYKSLSIVQGKTVTNLEYNNIDVKSENATSMSVTLTSATGLPLNFDVILAGGYFFMKNVMYNNIHFLSSDVYAPTDFSYFCGNLTLSNLGTETVPSYTLQWNYFQFQAPFGHTKNESFIFGDAWHCVGFFTGGILSGLLIVALLLTITFVGVCWMMDINTMDRFDDPKGKTITINASD